MSWGQIVSRRSMLPGTGFNVLDGASLVLGAAIASVHLRDLASAQRLSGFGWAMMWVTFTGIALSSAGPFLFVLRRFVRQLPDYPHLGDILWGVLGLPWILAAAFRPADPASVGRVNREGPSLDSAMSYEVCLWVGLIAACLFALVVVWKNWVIVPPEQARSLEKGTWTDRFGLALAVAWPLQCAFGLVVVG